MKASRQGSSALANELSLLTKEPYLQSKSPADGARDLFLDCTADITLHTATLARIYCSTHSYTYTCTHTLTHASTHAHHTLHVAAHALTRTHTHTHAQTHAHTGIGKGGISLCVFFVWCTQTLQSSGVRYNERKANMKTGRHVLSWNELF